MRTIEDASYSEITTIMSNQIYNKQIMPNQILCTESIGGDASLIVQVFQHREVAELRWDGASELIQVEVPERSTMTQ